MKRAILAAPFLGVLALSACFSFFEPPVPKPSSVRNDPDDFLLRATDLDSVNVEWAYAWVNNGDSAVVTYSNSLTTGYFQLVMEDSAAGQLYYHTYLAGSSPTGVHHTEKWSAGVWRIRVILANATGSFEIRVQSAP